MKLMVFGMGWLAFGLSVQHTVELVWLMMLAHDVALTQLKLVGMLDLDSCNCTNGPTMNQVSAYIETPLHWDIEEIHILARTIQ